MYKGEDDLNFRSGLIDFTAGSLGGIALVYVSQPLDTVKVKMQTFPQLYKGMTECILQTFRKDGIVRGLYAGTVPAIISNVAENSILFAAYGGCKNFVAKLEKTSNPNDLSVIGSGFAGFLAAFFSSFTLCPTELVKVKLQALREASHNQNISITPYKLTKQILKKEGITGLFYGLSPTLAREMPGYFFFFSGYEGARHLLKDPNQSKDEIGPIKTMIAGAIGGICLWTAIFPTDVIKSRIQVNNMKVSMSSMFINILRNEGFLALYSGLLPTVLRTIPATAVLFVVYEYSKKFMDNLFL